MPVRKSVGNVEEYAARASGANPGTLPLGWCLSHPPSPQAPKVDSAQQSSEDGEAWWSYCTVSVLISAIIPPGNKLIKLADDFTVRGDS